MMTVECLSGNTLWVYDVDEDNEIRVTIQDKFDDSTTIWLNREELEQLVEHLTKCINEIKEIENKNEQ